MPRIGRKLSTPPNTITTPNGIRTRRAEGRLIHAGRQLATAEARLLGPDGTLYAHATTTCLVFEMPAAKA